MGGKEQKKHSKSKNNYFVSVKLFSEANINKTYRAHDLWEVSETSMMMRPFRPKSLHFNEKQKFGVIRGDNVCLLHVLKMAETLEDLDLGRAIVPIRKSIGNESIARKKFKIVEEGETIHQGKESRQKSIKKGRTNDEEMRKKLDKDEKGSSSSNGGEKKKKKEKKPVEPTTEENIITQDLKVVEDDIGGVKQSVEIVENANDNASPDLITPVPSSDPENRNNSNSIWTDANQCEKCQVLEEQVKVLEAQVQSVPQLEEEIKVLQKQLETAQATGNNVISELREQMTKMPELVRVFSMEKQFLKDEKYIVTPEKAHKKIQVGDDEVYCGNGIVVKKFDIYEVTEQITLGKRVARLCDLFWGKEQVYCHFLSGKCARAPSNMIVQKITLDEIKAIKRILKKMAWEGINKTDLNETGIREHIKHYTSSSLTRHLGTKRAAKPKKVRKPATTSDEDGDKEEEGDKGKKGKGTNRKKIIPSSSDEEEEGDKRKKGNKRKKISPSTSDESSGEEEAKRNGKGNTSEEDKKDQKNGRKRTKISSDSDSHDSDSQFGSFYEQK